MEKPHAYLRRFLVVHSFIIATLLSLLVLVTKEWTPIGKMVVLITGIGNSCLVFWVVIDAVVVLCFLRRARPVIGPQNFFQIFFLEGRSWRQLRQLDAEIRPIIDQLVRRAQPFPELRRTIRQVLATEGAEKVSELLQQAEQRVLSRAKEAEETERREERRIRERFDLVHKGVDLGIPEKEMWSLVSAGIDHARTAVAKKEREKALLDRAAGLGCTTAVTRWMQWGNLDGAETVLIKAASVIERARAVGIEDAIRFIIAQDNLTFAEHEVARTEEEHRLQLLMSARERRISELPEPRQPEARRLFERLCSTVHDPREFRKALHELEQVLTR